jgi:hypothetical protein
VDKLVSVSPLAAKEASTSNKPLIFAKIDDRSVVNHNSKYMAVCANISTFRLHAVSERFEAETTASGQMAGIQLSESRVEMTMIKWLASGPSAANLLPSRQKVQSAV